MLEFEYARAALKNGIKIAEQVGVNPFEFGIIGSSDSHTSMAAVEEDNFLGKFVLNLPKPGRWKENTTGGAADTVKGEGGLWSLVSGLWSLVSGLRLPQVASGDVGVWSTANTREEIFNAFRRKEVYAATGPRIALRLFAGFGFKESDLARPDTIEYLYKSGVPMGNRLIGPGTDAPLTIIIFAAKDPIGNNLERVQVIKGWVDADGRTLEKVYDARIAKEEGAPLLDTLWQDPDFRPDENAFYYARVIEVARQQHKTAGQIVSELLRNSLTSSSTQEESQVKEKPGVFGFEPFPSLGQVMRCSGRGTDRSAHILARPPTTTASKKKAPAVHRRPGVPAAGSGRHHCQRQLPPGPTEIQIPLPFAQHHASARFHSQIK